MPVSENTSLTFSQSESVLTPSPGPSGWSVCAGAAWAARRPPFQAAAGGPGGPPAEAWRASWAVVFSCAMAPALSPRRSAGHAFYLRPRYLALRGTGAPPPREERSAPGKPAQTCCWAQISAETLSEQETRARTASFQGEHPAGSSAVCFIKSNLSATAKRIPPAGWPDTAGKDFPRPIASGAHRLVVGETPAAG